MILVVWSIVMMVIILRNMERKWYCKCGKLKLFTRLDEPSCDSQHLIDVYSLTHITHGIFLYLLTESFAITIMIECLWEVIENTAWLIERYRAKTISKGYYGDTIVNSLGDICCCMLGTLVPYWFVFFIIESILALTIRDNLILNVVMLIHPFEFIKKWQQR